MRRDGVESTRRELIHLIGIFTMKNCDLPAIHEFSDSNESAPSIGHLDQRSRAKLHRGDTEAISAQSKFHSVDAAAVGLGMSQSASVSALPRLCQPKAPKEQATLVLADLEAPST